MDIQTKLLTLTALVYLFNIPFGYWRTNVKKFSLQWVLAVHLPVPPIILARIFSHIGFHWTTYVYLVGGFFLGQFTGNQIYKWKQNKEHKHISSCLFVDVFCPSHH